MKRPIILLDPDPPEAGAGGTGDPTPKPKPEGKEDPTPTTSADTGAKGKTAKEIALEKKVATLEDEQNTIKGQLKNATEWIKQQVESKPAPTQKGSIVDEVNSILGWGTD